MAFGTRCCAGFCVRRSETAFGTSFLWPAFAAIPTITPNLQVSTYYESPSETALVPVRSSKPSEHCRNEARIDRVNIESGRSDSPAGLWARICLVIPSVDRFISLASTGRSSTWATEISTVNGLAAPPCEIHPNIERQPHKPHPNSPATRPTTPVRCIQHLSHILPPPPTAVASVQVVASPCCSPGRSLVSTVEQDERIWSEILERSLSSSSLHHLQRLQRNHDDEDDEDEDDGNNRPTSRVAERATSTTPHQDKRRNGNPPGNWHV